MEGQREGIGEVRAICAFLSMAAVRFWMVDVRVSIWLQAFWLSASSCATFTSRSSIRLEWSELMSESEVFAASLQSGISGGSGDRYSEAPKLEDSSTLYLPIMWELALQERVFYCEGNSQHWRLEDMFWRLVRDSSVFINRVITIYIPCKGFLREYSEETIQGRKFPYIYSMDNDYLLVTCKNNGPGPIYETIRILSMLE